MIDRKTDLHLDTKSFKISPNKESFRSPLRTPIGGSFDILNMRDSQTKETIYSDRAHGTRMLARDPPLDRGNPEDQKNQQKQIRDLTIVNKDLVDELDSLQAELKAKDEAISSKSFRIDELIRENNRLLNEIKNEREINESDFNSWLDLKLNLENQILNLKTLIKAEPIKTLDNTNASNDMLDLQIRSYENDINKLTKKVAVFQKEIELEIQSKTLIMDELEIMRQRYFETDEKYQLLKLQYNDLIEELSLIDNEINLSERDLYKVGDTRQHQQVLRGNDADDSIDNSEPYAPMDDTDNDSDAQFNQENDMYFDPRENILKVKKRRISSQNSNSADSRISSLRNISLNKAMRDIGLRFERQKFNQKIREYEFEINSLKLQQDKLLSFIGFSSQINSTEFNNIFRSQQRVPSNNSTASNKTLLDSIEYSDAYNIRTAKKNLRTVIKSASALPMRPTTSYNENNTLLNVANLRQLSSSKSTENLMDLDFTNNSALDCSTDYNQGEVELLDLGNSDSFEEFGDDELDDDDDDVVILARSGNTNDIIENHGHGHGESTTVTTTTTTIAATEDRSRIMKKGKSKFSSNGSLNFTYQMSLITPQKKNGKPMHIQPRRQHTQFKRLTPSILNLKTKKFTDRSDSDHDDPLEPEDEAAAGEFADEGAEAFLGPEASNAHPHELVGEMSEDHGFVSDGFCDDLGLIKGVGVGIGAGCGNRAPAGFPMYQISEEDESEYNDNYNMDFSSSDDDDDDDDATFSISNQEIDLFKIDFLRRLYCPKHSMFQCCCKSMDLVNPFYFKIFSSPIYSLRRKLRKGYNAAAHGGNSSRLKTGVGASGASASAPVSSSAASSSASSSASAKRAYPLRYHKHEQDILHFNYDAAQPLDDVSAQDVD